MLYSDVKVQEAVKYYEHHHEKEVIRLKMKHVEGAFGVLIIGMCCAFICFVLELLIYRYYRPQFSFNL